VLPLVLVLTLDLPTKVALLLDRPRAATVVAGGEGATLLSLDRRLFERVMGPLKRKLKQDVQVHKDPCCEFLQSSLLLTLKSPPCIDLQERSGDAGAADDPRRKPAGLAEPVRNIE